MTTMTPIDTVERVLRALVRGVVGVVLWAACWPYGLICRLLCDGHGMSLYPYTARALGIVQVAWWLWVLALVAAEGGAS